MGLLIYGPLAQLVRAINLRIDVPVVRYHQGPPQSDAVATEGTHHLLGGSFFYVYLSGTMAPSKGKSKSAAVIVKIAKKQVRRKGIHAKTKMSKNKNSKNYVKVSRGQG